MEGMLGREVRWLDRCFRKITAHGLLDGLEGVLEMVRCTAVA